jgi:hypothetical protein
MIDITIASKNINATSITKIHSIKPPKTLFTNNIPLTVYVRKGCENDFESTINIWSMEGAIESGKITANYILDKYNKPNIYYFKHNDNPFYIKLIHYIDNILYKLCLPNIITLLIIVILFYILYRYIINSKKI